MTMDPQMARAIDINAYQANPHVHPLPCGRNSNHRPLAAYLEWIVTQKYELTLRCLDCDYVQAHIPDIDYAKMSRIPSPFAVLNRQ